jgi:hypothetical protein
MIWAYLIFISFLYKEDGTIFGADSIYKHVFGADGMYVSAPQVLIDPVTALVSAQRLSKISSRLLERARETVEKLVSGSIQKIRK